MTKLVGSSSAERTSSTSGRLRRPARRARRRRSRRRGRRDLSAAGAATRLRRPVGDAGRLRLPRPCHVLDHGLECLRPRSRSGCSRPRATPAVRSRPASPSCGTCAAPTAASATPSPRVRAGTALQISVVLICQTGGHGDGFLAGPGLESTLMPECPGRPPYLVDGAGVDAPLPCAPSSAPAPTSSRSRRPAGSSPTTTTRSSRSSRARRSRSPSSRPAGKGRHVATHAYGGEGLDNAVEAGVRSIEHGGFLTEEQAARMATPAAGWCRRCRRCATRSSGRRRAG